eukprot:gene9507-12058_t
MVDMEESYLVVDTGLDNMVDMEESYMVVDTGLDNMVDMEESYTVVDTGVDNMVVTPSTDRTTQRKSCAPGHRYPRPGGRPPAHSPTPTPTVNQRSSRDPVPGTARYDSTSPAS